MKPTSLCILLVASLLLTLAACGGGDDEAPAPQPPSPPAGTVVGAAGGTVAGPNGAKVEIPAGALANNVTINIAPSAPGTPPIPGGFTAFGQMFAFTPHGTTFATPVTVTIPFDPAAVPAGSTPSFYKTNAQGQWEVIAGATFGATSVSGQVTSFSDLTVVTEPVELVELTRVWSFREYRGDALEEVGLDEGTQIEGDLIERYDFGEANFDLEDNGVPPDGIATGEIYSTADGVTYSVFTEAPLGNAVAPEDPIGSKARLVQYATFIKNSDDATYSFTLTGAFVTGHDGTGPQGRLCPAHHQLLRDTCDLIKGDIFLDVKAYSGPEGAPQVVFFRTAGGAMINGSAGAWLDHAWSTAQSRTPLWDSQDFVTTREEFNGPAGSIYMDMLGPRTYIVPLSSVKKGDTFTVHVVTHAYAYNRAAGVVSGQGSESETAANAYLRDPSTIGGTTVVTTGLTRIPTPMPLVEPSDAPVEPAPCLPGPGPDPAAGLIQFEAASYTQLESSTTSEVTITRTGGSTGAVTATFTSSDGTAVGGGDYIPVNASVFFADGDAQPRVVEVPIIPDTLSDEGDKTVNLTLTQPGGCAALGSQTTTVLTIRDDDVPPPPASFTVGGTVTGLVGTGLKLQDLHVVPITPGNGPFTFTLPTETGSPYEVSIVTQPINPVQVCSVTNGSGTMGNANVTNVVVSCASTPPPSGLDPGFGSGTGIVSTAFGGDETAMVLQPDDGKILMVGGSSTDFVLARYGPDGSLDGGFGDGGLVTTDIAGSSDAALGVALQEDGRIIVVGSARVAGNDDVAIVRYDPDGTLDETFGTLGKTTTNFFGGRDRAVAVTIQPDGSIVVAGDTVVNGGTDFALARYSATGVLDTSFGGLGTGRRNTDIAGGVDLALNIAQEPGGTLLVTGRTTIGTSSSLGHAGLARYSADGLPDASIGPNGTRSIVDLSVGDALAVQPDGRILLVGSVPEGGRRAFALMRLESSGSPDLGFGVNGLVSTQISVQDDYGRAIALMSDGRILVAGQTSNLSNPDFAVARYLSTGAPDTSFDGDGEMAVDFFGSFDGADSVAVQGDGKIVLGGFARNGSRTGYGLARINP